MTQVPLGQQVLPTSVLWPKAEAQQDSWFKLVVLGELEETGSVVEQCPTLGLPWDLFWVGVEG